LLYVQISPDGQATNLKLIKSVGFGLDEKAADASPSGTSRPAKGMEGPLPWKPPSRSTSGFCENSFSAVSHRQSAS